MITAQIEAKRFIGWLAKYNHQGGFDNLGQALHRWCVVDRGVTRLDCDYAQFLQMVVAVLVTAKDSLRVGIDVNANEYRDLSLPKAFDGWLPDRYDFQAAVAEAKMLQSEMHERTRQAYPNEGKQERG
ncbi:MAG TPA: hypothetical protein DEQ23_07365 [Chlorobium sp.]|nr:hypothetical protein [Chlorobium sp.]